MFQVLTVKVGGEFVLTVFFLFLNNKYLKMVNPIRRKHNSEVKILILNLLLLRFVFQ